MADQRDAEGESTNVPEEGAGVIWPCLDRSPSDLGKELHAIALLELRNGYRITGKLNGDVWQPGGEHMCAVRPAELEHHGSLSTPCVIYDDEHVCAAYSMVHGF